ncbi:hypothetical protein NX059_007055 [Plenodomus lindquistii]|nr:hypothetical protein NX059_007055 [Plenodomus lindquistii]
MCPSCSSTQRRLSAYGLYLSYQNITRLQQYEKTSEKAAEWSNTAAQRLRKTRTTQGSGTVTLILSFLSSTTLLLLPSHATPPTLLLTSGLNTLFLFASQTHMNRFWNDSTQTRVPFLEKFNEAIRGSEKVVWALGTLGVGWGAAAIVWWMKGGNGIWGFAVGLRVWYWVRKGGM